MNLKKNGFTVGELILLVGVLIISGLIFSSIKKEQKNSLLNDIQIAFCKSSCTTSRF